MRTTKVFSVEDGTIQVMDKDILLLWENIKDDFPIAYTGVNFSSTHTCFKLPSTLIRTDEVIAEEYAEGYMEEKYAYNGFLAGRKSFDDKEFHLSKDDIDTIISCARSTTMIGMAEQYSYNLETIIDEITPNIYPNTITVEHDGEKYIWSTIKADY
jgi:hypothetical protein